MELDFILSVFGMVMIIEGLPHFTFPAKMKAYMKQLSGLPEKTLRTLGLVLMLMGLLFVYFGKG